MGIGAPGRAAPELGTMREQSSPPQHPPAAVIPPALPDVAEVKALSGYRLQVTFADGLQGEVNMSAFVRSPAAGVFAALADPTRFAQAEVSLGAVTWPDGLDLAPDAMYEAIAQHGCWVLD